MNTSLGMEKEEIVKNALFKFMKQHLPCPQVGFIDEIVLSYVVSILEELGAEPSGDVEDVFDAEGFCEMMGAYVPEFSRISLPNVCQWMFELEAKLRQTRGRNDSYSSSERDLSELLVPLSVNERVRNSSECSSGGVKSVRTHQLSEASDGSCSSDSSSEYCAHEEVGEMVEVLREMFPWLPLVEARHCLSIAGGDVQTAAQLVLHRQETGEALTHSIIQSGAQQKCVVDDQELKSRIIARYSFVDKEDDTREHRPVAPKSEPKKLVRYRDNKIVSMKGERYTEVKRDDEEDNKKWSGGAGRGKAGSGRPGPGPGH